jgi:putative transposase
MAGEGLPVQLATRVLGVSESGYYESLTRPPSARSIRHAWLTDQIRAVHAVGVRPHMSLGVRPDVSFPWRSDHGIGGSGGVRNRSLSR